MVVASTGFFDGVHSGHRAILRQLSETARERGSESAVVTFWPHPRFILGQDSEKLRLLNTLDEKIELITRCGIDDVRVIDFTLEFGRMDAADFISEYLVRQYSVDALIVGYDHRIGRDCLTGRELAEAAEKCGVEVFCVDEHTIGVSHVSSTVIRHLIEAGDVEKAAEMLGYNYGMCCVAGACRDVCYSLEPENWQKIVPAEGRYSVNVTLGNSSFSDVCFVKGDSFKLQSEKIPTRCEITFLERIH